MMKRKFWGFVHNCLVHPAMGVVELFCWEGYFPDWLENLHERTAELAGFNSP
jgi:hypothetical protein